MNTLTTPAWGDSLSPSESLYGFVAWLSARSETTEFGLSHGSEHAHALVRQFCEANGLPQPRAGWTANAKFPIVGGDDDAQPAD